MAEAAVQEVPLRRAINGAAKPVPPARRFEIPDLDRHAVWFLPRFMKAYPHLDQRQAVGFLRGVLYSNEFLFLYQDHAVGLAQSVSEHTLQAQPVIWERFVFCENPDNAEHVAQAATFYEEIARWAKRKNVSSLVVKQVSDVPDAVIEDKLGPLSPVEMVVARV
jgi:hypothetical protein